MSCEPGKKAKRLWQSRFNVAPSLGCGPCHSGRGRGEADTLLRTESGSSPSSLLPLFLLVRCFGLVAGTDVSQGG
jgi:hypothetical protein